jgi:hypothetical protein
MIAATSANAALIDDMSPLAGIDYQQIWMQGKGDWNNLFPKSFPGATAYVGARFCECLGVELGYDWGAKESKNFTLPAGSSFFGQTVTTAVTGTARVRRQGGHLDLIGYLPIVDCIELMGVIGVGYVYPKVSISTSGVTPLDSGLQSVATKGKTVARIRLGGNYMFTECIGVRALVGWESTSSLRLKGNNNFSISNLNNKGWRGSTTVATGVFVKF